MEESCGSESYSDLSTDPQQLLILLLCFDFDFVLDLGFDFDLGFVLS